MEKMPFREAQTVTNMQAVIGDGQLGPLQKAYNARA